MGNLGYICTSKLPYLRVMKHIYLTDKAHLCRDELAEHIDALSDRMLDGLTQQEELQLFDLLKRVYGNIK